MDASQACDTSLPIRCDFRLAYVLSFVVALLLAATSAAGLLYRAVLYPADDLFLAFVPNDALNLLVGLPILLGSMWLARRGKLIGLLCWPGALFYVLYIYVLYVIGVPFNALFLPYILLITLSAYTTIGIVAGIDGEAVRQRLVGVVPARTAGGILAGLAILLFVRQLAIIVTILTSGTAVDTLEVMLWIDDLILGCPTLLIGGLLLWRREALGYVAGAGLFLLYGTLAVGLFPVMLFQARLNAVPVDVAGIVIVLIMAAICFIPFAFFVRGAASDRVHHLPDGRGQVCG